MTYGMSTELASPASYSLLAVFSGQFLIGFSESTGRGVSRPLSLCRFRCDVHDCDTATSISVSPKSVDNCTCLGEQRRVSLAASAPTAGSGLISRYSAHCRTFPCAATTWNTDQK
eukprot:6208205-Pleurochrysis_carterae.AAC.1